MFEECIINVKTLGINIYTIKFERFTTNAKKPILRISLKRYDFTKQRNHNHKDNYKNHNAQHCSESISLYNHRIFHPLYQKYGTFQTNS